jgi:ribosomal-protein-alanine N-acetyltransferase
MKVPADEVILSERCRLRHPDEADIPHVWSASLVPGFNDGLAWERPENAKELEVGLKQTRKAWAKGSAYAWTAECLETGIFIGRIVIRREGKPGEWAIGYWVHPAHQGTGYATEIAAAIVDFGFRRLGAIVIRAAHATWNDASRKVLQRIGMTFVGTNPRGFEKRGNWVEEY